MPNSGFTVVENALMILLFDLLSTEKRESFYDDLQRFLRVACGVVSSYLTRLFKRKSTRWNPGWSMFENLGADGPGELEHHREIFSY